MSGENINLEFEQCEMPLIVALHRSVYGACSTAAWGGVSSLHSRISGNVGRRGDAVAA